MKKLLIIGASILQLPAIKKAKEMGLEVAVADFNPKAIGIPYADVYFNASTIDVEAIVEVASKYNPDGIMTLATDMPMRSIAAVCEKMGLSGISVDTAFKSTDKIAMIEAFKEHDVPSPWFVVVKDYDDLINCRERLSYPCIMKPADNSGSRGVVKINNSSELENAYHYSVVNSRNGKVLIEELLEGDEVSVEIVVYNKEISVLQVTDKLTTGAPNYVEMGHSQPSKFSGDVLKSIQEVARKAVEAVKIENGPAHVEMIVTEEGPKMVELGARMGGDCITTHLVPLSTGIDMVKASIDISLGNAPNLEKSQSKGSAIRYFDTPKGIIRSIQGIDKASNIDGIKEISFTKSIGEEASDIHSSLDRIGFVIAQASTPEDAIGACQKAIDEIKVEIDMA